MCDYKGGISRENVYIIMNIAHMFCARDSFVVVASIACADGLKKISNRSV